MTKRKEPVPLVEDAQAMAAWFRKLDQAREKVERLTRERRAAVQDRNAVVQAAKQAGLPAAVAYSRAGITQSTYSRQGGDAPAQ